MSSTDGAYSLRLKKAKLWLGLMKKWDVDIDVARARVKDAFKVSLQGVRDSDKQR